MEEGEAVITVKAVGGSSRYEKIAAMIEDTEKLKSGLEARPSTWRTDWSHTHLAGTAPTYCLPEM